MNAYVSHKEFPCFVCGTGIPVGCPTVRRDTKRAHFICDRLLRLYPRDKVDKKFVRPQGDVACAECGGVIAAKELCVYLPETEWTHYHFPCASRKYFTLWEQEQVLSQFKVRRRKV